MVFIESLSPWRVALADDPAAAASSSTQLTTVVVTANKREGYVNAIPTSISAFAGEDLKAVGIADTRDLAKLVPGFTFADSGFNTPIYTLRGVGFADSSFANTSTVGVYADEVSLAYPVMTKGPNLDLLRVEVLKGPQGTLYGRNSTGGTINYIANKPTRYFASGVEVGYGSFGRFDAEAFVSGPIGKSLRVRFATSLTESNEGSQISATRPDDRLGKLSKRAARGTLDWQALEDVSLRFTVSGWLDKSEPQAPYALALQAQSPFPLGNLVFSPRVLAYPLRPDNDNPRIAEWNPDAAYGLNDNFWLASLRPHWQIADSLGLTGVFSYAQVRSDGSLLPQGGLDVEDIDQALYAYIRTVSGEIRLDGTIGEHADWLIGVSSNFDKYNERIQGRASENSLNFPLYGSTAPFFTPLLLDRGAARGIGQIRSNGVFVDGNWEFVPTLKLTLGARYTRETQDYSGCTFEELDNNSILPLSGLFTVASLLRGGNTVVQKGECGSLDAQGNAGLFTAQLREHNLSYRSVLSWTPVKDALFYGSYSRGYKAGGFPTVFSVDQASLAPVVQEKLDAYEIGAKLTLLDKRLQLNSAAYYYNYRNKQLLTYFTDPVFGALQYLQNVPKSLVEGGELSIAYTPLDKLFLTAVGSYVRTKVIEFQGLTSQGAPFDFAGQPFNYTPRLQASLIANYSFPINRDLNLSPGVNFTYTGGSNSTLEHDPLFALDAHRVWDARLGLSPNDRSWMLTAYARNFTDEFYKGSVIKLGDSVFAYAGPPRTWGVNFNYNFRNPRR